MKCEAYRCRELQTEEGGRKRICWNLPGMVVVGWFCFAEDGEADASSGRGVVRLAQARIAKAARR